MKKILYYFFALTFTVLPLYAQEDIEPINTGAANFLLIPTDARGAAMGGAGIALMGRENAIFYNGATAMLDENPISGISYTYSPWMRQYQSGHPLQTIGAFYKLNNRNALLAGYRYYGYPEIIDIDGLEKNTNPREMAFELGYARELLSELAMSATVRYIRSDMGKAHGAKVANAVSFDVGAVYKKDISALTDAYWTAGLQLSNLGTKIKYLETKESLPAMIKVGGSVDLPFTTIHRLIVAADGGYRMMPSDVTAFNIGAGAEYTLMDHFMLRGGYYYGDKKKADHSYASAGAGVKCWGASLDFAWLFAEKSNPLRNTFLISAAFNLRKR